MSLLILRDATLTISDFIEIGSPVETEIVRVVSHSTTEMSDITRLKKKPRSSGMDTLIACLKINF